MTIHVDQYESNSSVHHPAAGNIWGGCISDILVSIMFSVDQYFVAKRIVSNMPPAYQVEFENKDSILKKGKLEPIQVTVETRTGNKKACKLYI
ncbi:hypothetical protein TNCV_4928751 [Trichonephila clavipes]|nr:hypothetical protein TNCV_4928751 [Trichonephila clavipes]